MEPLLLETRNLTKRYPGIIALNQVSLGLEKGHISALVGENGAGKSTFIKMLAGVIRPDGGEICLEGQPVQLTTPQEARRQGIAVVHQHTHLIPDLSVAENYALRQGYTRQALGLIAWRKVKAEAAEAIRTLVPSVDISRDARSLSGVEQQLVELAFGLAANPRILILDEPTAVLPFKETEELFERVKSFASQGGSVLFVSHRLDEVFSLADRVTVLRDGQVVWHKAIGETNHDDLIRGMVGRAVTFERDETSVPTEEVQLTLRGASDRAAAFRDVTFTLKRGEIYGIYGLVGAGQSELCQALFGLRRYEAETLASPQTDFQGKTPRQRVRGGMAYVPGDRLGQGMFYQMSVGENLSIASLERRSHLGLISGASEREDGEKAIQELDIRTQGLRQSVLHLSGGNQQKVLLGRWLETKPEILILEEPTQGVDVGAKGEIHRIARELAKQGVAILLVTSDIPELLALSHRVGVMREGQLVGELDMREATEDNVLKLALPDSQSKAAAKQARDQQEKSSGGGLMGALRWFVSQRETSLAVLMVVLGAIFALTVPAFAKGDNLRDIAVTNSILLIGALGMTAVIISGGVDLSVGAILGLAAIAAGKADLAGLPTPVIAGGALVVGLLLGTLNGTISVLGRVHTMVITLGTLFIFRGLTIQITGGKWLLNLSPKVTQFGQSAPMGVPVLLLIGFLATVAMHLFLRYSVPGRKLYALGGNKAAAQFLGIYPGKIVPLAFGLSGLFVGLAGLLHAGMYGQVQNAVGDGYELKVIAAAVIGGTDIMGGRGSAVGTFLGAMFIGAITNILVLTHVSSFWDGVITGAMILLTLMADFFLKRRGGNA